MSQRAIICFGLIAATFLTLSFAVAKEKEIRPESLYGTWHREFQTKSGSTVRIMKIITPTHYAVFQQAKLEKSHALIQAHGGPYNLKGNTFTEIYEYSSRSRLFGRSIPSEVRLVDDKLHQSWRRSGGVLATEVWTRSTGKEKRVEKTKTKARKKGKTKQSDKEKTGAADRRKRSKE